MLSRRLIVAIGSYGILGFYRGGQEYNYNFEKDLQSGRKKSTQYLYTEQIARGIMGLTFYICPFLFPFTFMKELYRLEVVVRGLEEEKRGDQYNRLAH